VTHVPWIFQYFWFVCAAIMLLNILTWKRRLAGVVERGNATQAEVDHFIRWARVYLVGGPIAFGVIALVADWPSPFCSGIMVFDDVSHTLVSLLTLSGWIGFLWWIWRRDGAEFLARVAPALGTRPNYDARYSPRLVRMAITAIVLLGGVGSVIVWRTMPTLPNVGCQLSGTVGDRISLLQ
jgi:hypothetical protein